MKSFLSTLFALSLSWVISSLFGQAMPVQAQAQSFHERPHAAKVGMTEERLEQIQAQLAGEFTQEVKARRGENLRFAMKWEDTDDSLQTHFEKDEITVYFSGGLARHLSEDAFLLAACHEIGHILGAYPYRLILDQDQKPVSFSSSEGQADYYAAHHCFKRMVKNHPPFFLSEASGTDLDTTACAISGLAPLDQAVCVRTVKAGFELATFFYREDMRAPGRNPHPPTQALHEEAVSRTYASYTTPQCAFETYFAGAICNEKQKSLPLIRTLKDGFDAQIEASDLSGSCEQQNGDRSGMRPACWYQAKAGVVFEKFSK